MAKFLKYIPPIYVVEDRGGANNNGLRIWIGRKHRFPAAVACHEYAEFLKTWIWHHGPAVLSCIGAAIFASRNPHLAEESIGVALLLFLIFELTPHIKPLARRIGYRGQTVEALQASRIYPGETLEGQLEITARQLGSVDYGSKYGTERWTHARRLEELRKNLPAAESWLRRHHRFAENARKFFAAPRNLSA